jgi:hypothetical protein
VKWLSSTTVNAAVRNRTDGDTIDAEAIVDRAVGVEPESGHAGVDPRFVPACGCSSGRRAVLE